MMGKQALAAGHQPQPCKHVRVRGGRGGGFSCTWMVEQVEQAFAGISALIIAHFAMGAICPIANTKMITMRRSATTLMQMQARDARASVRVPR